MIDTSVCEHGGLRRKCDMCDLIAENERLRQLGAVAGLLADAVYGEIDSADLQNYTKVDAYASQVRMMIYESNRAGS